MKNLKQLEVTELSLEEQKNIEGGSLTAIMAGIFFIAGALWAIFD